MKIKAQIGIPKEIKVRENRVALLPDAVGALVEAGFSVAIETGAGQGAGFTDAAYRQAGAAIAPNAEALYGGSQLIVKVKEPQQEEVALLKKDHLLFCYLHLAADMNLARALADIGLTAIGFETVTADGQLPLLAPMSGIAGQVAVQLGAHHLHQTLGGRGVLLGGVPGTDAGHVVVLGGGTAGSAAAGLAAAMGARVTVFDIRAEALAGVEKLHPRIKGMYASRDALTRVLPETDLLIGAVLVVGDQAPVLVSEAMVKTLPQGAVMVDIAIDQGGCIETMEPTTYDAPAYCRHGVTHIGVTNLPGAVARTASQALSGALLPYVKTLAGGNWHEHEGLSAGVNVSAGQIVHPALQHLL